MKYLATTVFSLVILFNNVAFAQAQQRELDSPFAAGLGAAIKNTPVNPSPIKETVTNMTAPDVSKPPAGTYDEFLYFEKQCKANIAVACLNAGNIMMAEKPPKEIYDQSSSKRTTRALQFYERAIDQGNLQAMEAAYDLYYDPYPVQRLLNSYTDTARAKELLDVMISKNYSGGLARQAKDYIENPEYLMSIEKKRAGCEILRNLANQNNLADATKKIVDNLNSSMVCVAQKK
ncbi:hypothetical protein [Polynucleobacter paneuropaeus]|jgi:TPR repeat protein|uniref:hypothetical protein n=1 Tax=Polynucleobacter paneuropaeus TaxID=2527775 RepID=UPI001BFD41D5|nr:hypothetical protein [Polynucleobacter paneuropaeus]MBT8622542.1 hypothetical protein [Polynucleobacter paneuropaeus]